MSQLLKIRLISLKRAVGIVQLRINAPAAESLPCWSSTGWELDFDGELLAPCKAVAAADEVNQTGASFEKGGTSHTVILQPAGGSFKRAVALRSGH